MLFGKLFLALSCFFMMAIGSPHKNGQQVVSDIKSFGQSMSNLRQDAAKLSKGHLPISNLMADDRAILSALDNLRKHANAANSFSPNEASDIVSATRPVADETRAVSKIFINKRGDIPDFLHPTVVQYLNTIMTRAENAGNAVVQALPSDKKNEARKLYGVISNAMHEAADVYSKGG